MSENKIETMAFEADVSRALELVIHSLYTNKEIFLRELISNASDACDKLRYSSLSDSALAADDLKITVRLDKENSSIIVTDTGIGMNKEELIQNLGTIAHSGTKRFMEALDKENKNASQMIGQFGVGFYSSYMVADKVRVESTKAGSGHTYIWESSGMQEYTITESDEPLSTGTRITVFIKSEESSFLDRYKLENIITTYSDHVSFPIYFQDGDSEPEQINKASALWRRTKSEVTTEEYNEFYHHIAHSPDTPWLTMHHKAEGTVEYNCLLYIPSIKPYDLFHPDFKTRVKLYVKRVYITDDAVSIIPSYLRFLRGVVDSEDLPLNVSRETLQNTQLMGKIRQSIVTKLLNALSKKSTDEPEEYAIFWNNFGEVMKEGLCGSGVSEKEQLLSVSRFRTTKSGDKMVSLSDYILNMVEGQKDIFYLNGDHIETMRSNPILEGFTKRDIEVILLSEHVDDFWINVIPQYQNKSFRSIVSSSINLEEIKPLAGDEESKEEEIPDSTAIIDYCKKVLGNKVRDVVVSAKLVDSPSALSVPEGAMNIRMEKFMLSQNQLKQSSIKILEINPHHPILQHIGKMILNNDAGTPEVENMVQFLFHQACITSGEGLEDPFAFVRNVNQLLVKGL